MSAMCLTCFFLFSAVADALKLAICLVDASGRIEDRGGTKNVHLIQL